MYEKFHSALSLSGYEDFRFFVFFQAISIFILRFVKYGGFTLSLSFCLHSQFSTRNFTFVVLTTLCDNTSLQFYWEDFLKTAFFFSSANYIKSALRSYSTHFMKTSIFHLPAMDISAVPCQCFVVMDVSVFLSFEISSKMIRCFKFLVSHPKI